MYLAEVLRGTEGILAGRLIPAGRLLVTATLAEIDGAGDGERNILGFAGPTEFWVDCPTIILTGSMTFDIFDIAALETSGMLEGVILHEMGHAIGVGTRWEVDGFACSTCRTDLDSSWTCPAAVSTYADIGGSGDDIVELDLGPGSACGHLDEIIFGDELMTPAIDNVMFLSKMTAATLDDIDYIVDPSAVDPYSLPSERGASSINIEISEPSMIITDTAVETIIFGVDSNGNVVEERVGIEMEF